VPFLLTLTLCAFAFFSIPPQIPWFAKAAVELEGCDWSYQMADRKASQAGLSNRSFRTLERAIVGGRCPASFEKLEARAMFDGGTVVDDLSSGAGSNAGYIVDLAAGEETSPPPETVATTETSPPSTNFATLTTTSTTGSPPQGEGGSGTAPLASTSPSTNGTTRSPADFRYVIRPGTGFTGPTTQPAAVGNVGEVGYDAKAIARWDVVPYQTFTGIFNVGVVAFHREGIDRVEFSVNGSAEPTKVYTMTNNPETGVVEYTATLNARDFADGPLEVRAVAYPKVGEPRVLAGALTGTTESARGEHSMFLSANANGTLPSAVRYVSPTGNDVNDGLTAQTPVATMSRARNLISSAQGGDVGGGTIKLAAGSYLLGNATENWSITASRWLTIEAMEGVDQSAVVVAGSGGVNGLRTTHVRLHNVTITGAINSSGPLVDHLWYSDTSQVGMGRTTEALGAGGWSTRYVTGSSLRSTRDGFIGFNLARSVSVDDIGSDCFSGTGIVINATASNNDHTGTTFHPDVYQMLGQAHNVVLYGLTAVENIRGQGIFTDASTSVIDMAIVHTNVDNLVGAGGVGRVWQFGNAVTHMFVVDSQFVGPAVWRTDTGFVAQNVVIESTSWSSQPATLPGITFR